MGVHTHTTVRVMSHRKEKDMADAYMNLDADITESDWPDEDFDSDFDEEGEEEEIPDEEGEGHEDLVGEGQEDLAGEGHEELGGEGREYSDHADDRGDAWS